MAATKKAYGTPSGAYLAPLSDVDINDFFKNQSLYLGTYPKDELVGQLANRLSKKERGGLIINMGDRETGGSHWVAILMNKKNTVYFDSFGISPPTEIVEFMKKRKVPSFYSDRQMQALDSTSCGWWCILMVTECVLKNKDILDILPKFTFEPEVNELILQGVFKGCSQTRTP